MPQPTRAGAEDACSAYAPGRVELLGNHTDYNQGVVLAAAIDRGLTLAGTAREDNVIVLHSALWQGRVEVPIAELKPQTDVPWTNCVLGVVHELLAAGFPI